MKTRYFSFRANVDNLGLSIHSNGTSEVFNHGEVSACLQSLENSHGPSCMQMPCARISFSFFFFFFLFFFFLFTLISRTEYFYRMLLPVAYKTAGRFALDAHTHGAHRGSVTNFNVRTGISSFLLDFTWENVQLAKFRSIDIVDLLADHARNFN